MLISLQVPIAMDMDMVSKEVKNISFIFYSSYVSLNADQINLNIYKTTA